MEDQKKRERELLQKKMAAGVDFLGETDVKFQTSKHKHSYFIILMNRFGEFVDSLKPFKKDIVIIKANYDKSISLFFEILQQLFVINLFTAILYSYVIIKHYIDTKDKYVYFRDTYCGYWWDCIYFFSRYEKPLANWFVISNFLFAFIGMATCLYMWIKFDKKAQYQ